MFSSLQQGSIVYILDKTARPKLKYGEIVGVSVPNFTSLGSTVNLKISIDGTTQDFNNIPSNNSIISYNNGKLTISETKQGLQNEVDSTLQNSKQIIDNIETYKQNIIDCEEILKQLNPQFAKDKERDERLNSLEIKFEGVEDKLDQLLNIIKQK